ncbi:hypothetical protein HYPSUDRAFT_138248 [Hypholoma sublateritium FD-334 SS-4]|uniref:HlyIII-domain-containing protein n=1 Tax=Hypholoma sublateritium (strain FD-334 SS-4) TaxID=945553 RepID=A0A0D2L7G6_HYPSF|nr:hypothetical protein HYPSUDRAFT_138248 [Hypholoma sublateritium FD-334 SS-4]
MSQLSQRLKVRTPAKNSDSDSKPALRANPTSTAKTVHWNELEDWQKDNEYILSGYRRIQHSWRGCFASVFSYLHNETINIHSHLWGAILFGYLLSTYYQNYVELHSMATWKDAAVIAIFLSAAITCLMASAFYHTSGCHSKEAARYCHAYDYSGIIILIVGSFFPSIYYGFYCEPHIQHLYLTAMSLAGLGAAYIVLNPQYAKPTHRGARTAVFIALGLGAVVPLTHKFLTEGFDELINVMGTLWLVLSGALYIGGALLYAKRIPERLAPGRFDYFIASHQIFHICVVLAALAHYQGVLISFRYRMANPHCGQ